MQLRKGSSYVRDAGYCSAFQARGRRGPRYARWQDGDTRDIQVLRI
jgi:hypothetical protein